MPGKSVVLVASLITLAACESSVAPERCAGLVREGELHLVIGPRPGLFGYGESVFVGDTLHLSAEIRPAVGASVDIWGTGGCAVEYGAPIPAVIEWSSEDSRIATVALTGVVTGKQGGQAVITARAPAYSLTTSRTIYVLVRAGGP